MEDFKNRHPYQPIYNALIQASGKMVLVDKLLTRLKESGHKVGVTGGCGLGNRGCGLDHCGCGLDHCGCGLLLW